MAITLSTRQQEVYDKIIRFITEDHVHDTFILKGYAGTGKTTLAGFLTSHLNAIKCPFQVMAPTGRAAKVIRNKVGTGFTIHSSIYTPNVECYGIRDNFPNKSYSLMMDSKQAKDIKVIIIDESSMISDKKDKDNFFKTRGSLLADLFTYAEKSSIPKIIFIGDYAQLPPVSCSRSYALEADYLEKKHNRKVIVEELTEVMRQKGDSGILKEATEMRLSLKVSDLFQREHTIEANDKDIFEIDSQCIPAKYVEISRQPSMGNTIIISYTNRQTNTRNKEIRQLYFGKKAKTIEIGEILLICNNTVQNGMQLYNGDFAKVVDIGETSASSVVVYDWKLKENVKVPLTYRKIWIQLQDSPAVFPVMILENHIHELKGQLPDNVRNALYIDFCKRHPNLKEGSKKFKMAMLDDPFFNCVHAKYGYAITCHKSQGGEWDTVFVDYSRKNGKLNDDIRWAYTATTRARRRLFISNPPEHKPEV